MAGGLLQPIARKNLEKLISGLHQALAAVGVEPQAAQPGAVPIDQTAGAQPQQSVNSATGGSIGKE
jgi:hypothetical protein